MISIKAAVELANEWLVSTDNSDSTENADYFAKALLLAHATIVKQAKVVEAMPTAIELRALRFCFDFADNECSDVEHTYDIDHAEDCIDRLDAMADAEGGGA